jgi:hypothetical protein
MIAISYRRDDSLPVAGRLYDRLQATFGKPNIFMDFDSIRPGLDFRAQIRQTIDRSDVVIAVIGPGWLGAESDGSRRIDDPSDFVRLEIAHALQREIPIIPVLVNHTSMPKPETLPEDIRGLVYRHALPLDTGLDFHQHADRLIAGVSGLVDVPNDGNGKPATTRQGRTHLRRPVVVLSVLLLAVIGASAWFWFGRKIERGAAGTQGAAARVSTSSVAPSNPISPPDAKPMVEISSQPSGARVLNDGITIGTTPLRRDDLGLGPAKFVLMADGYLPRELSGKIDSVRGLKAEVSLALAAPLYAGEITVRGAGDSASNRPLESHFHRT